MSEPRPIPLPGEYRPRIREVNPEPLSEFRQVDFEGGQRGHIKLRAEVRAVQAERTPNTFVHVNIDGSAVAASSNGTMTHDDRRTRGHFLERVDVRIALGHEAFTLYQDNPHTTSGSSSTSSSTSMGIDLSTGFFGPTGTGNASFSYSIGTSFSRALNDFRVSNISGDRKLYHDYLLESAGGLYNNYRDLWPGGTATDIESFFLGDLSTIELRNPPHLSISNLPLISQAIFVGPKVNEDIELEVALVARFVKVSVHRPTFGIPPYEVKEDAVEVPVTAHIKISLSEMQW